MLPGYTHNIINLSDTEDLVTVMYCNEIFNPDKPDTYFDKVKNDHGKTTQIRLFRYKVQG